MGVPVDGVLDHAVRDGEIEHVHGLVIVQHGVDEAAGEGIAAADAVQDVEGEEPAFKGVVVIPHKGLQAVLRAGMRVAHVARDAADIRAKAFVTAGNTGAAMFNSLRKLGRIKGVARPALTTLFPTKNGHCIVLDIGANADCRPEYLQQFAIMGSVYAEKMLGIKNPRVGLLNNGEEPGKGNELMKNTYPLLESCGINFVGNGEAKDVFAEKADVVVTDGFTGNMLLKSSEATAKLMKSILKEGLMSSFPGKIAGLLAKPVFKELKSKLDPNEIGAAPLLGIDGLSVVGHGRSNSTALINGMKLAKNAADMDLFALIRDAVQTQLSE